MAADLEQVLARYDVQVRPGRREQVAKCPVHGDRVASMSVNLDKGVCSCHACGFGGSGYDLVMAMEQVDFAKARELVAEWGLEDGTERDAEALSPLAKAKSRKNRAAFVPPWRR